MSLHGTRVTRVLCKVQPQRQMSGMPGDVFFVMPGSDPNVMPGSDPNVMPDLIRHLVDLKIAGRGPQ